MYSFFLILIELSWSFKWGYESAGCLSFLLSLEQLFHLSELLMGDDEKAFFRRNWRLTTDAVNFGETPIFHIYQGYNRFSRTLLGKILWNGRAIDDLPNVLLVLKQNAERAREFTEVDAWDWSTSIGIGHGCVEIGSPNHQRMAAAITMQGISVFLGAGSKSSVWFDWERRAVDVGEQLPRKWFNHGPACVIIRRHTSVNVSDNLIPFRNREKGGGGRGKANNNRQRRGRRKSHYTVLDRCGFRTRRWASRWPWRRRLRHRRSPLYGDQTWPPTGLRPSLATTTVLHCAAAVRSGPADQKRGPASLWRFAYRQSQWWRGAFENRLHPSIVGNETVVVDSAPDRWPRPSTWIRLDETQSSQNVVPCLPQFAFPMPPIYQNHNFGQAFAIDKARAKRGPKGIRPEWIGFVAIALVLSERQQICPQENTTNKGDT